MEGGIGCMLGPLHTWDWEPVTNTLQKLSLVEKAEMVQVQFTPHLRDQRSMWMSDECKVYMDSYMASNGSCFMVTWTLGGRPNTKPGDHDTPNTHNRWFILFYHVWGPTWMEIHWNNIWLRNWSHITSHYTWGSVTTLHDFGGVLVGLWTLSFGLSQFHGHGSGFVCEVALSLTLVTTSKLRESLRWPIFHKTRHCHILLL